MLLLTGAQVGATDYSGMQMREESPELPNFEMDVDAAEQTLSDVEESEEAHDHPLSELIA